MAEESPPQHEGRDRETDMAADSEQQEVKKGIKELLKVMESLCRMLSKLLQRRERRADDLVLRYCKFIQVELSSIVASLNQMNSLLELRKEYTDSMFLCWLEVSREVVSSMAGSLDRSNQAGSHCFSRSARLPNRDGVEFALLSFFPVRQSFNRYKLLLQDDDGDCTSRMSSSAAQLHPYSVDTAENVFLVGIEGTLRNKQFKWFMAEGEADKETLKVMSMVGPAGVGKTTLAMEVYHQLRQIRGGHHFQCYVTAKVSRKPDMNKLLKHILSQIDEPTTLAQESSTEQSQIITLEDEPNLQAGEINRRLQDKRYLIVIDDIRENSDWDIINKAFPQNSPGSRIIVTTQLRSVAELCSSHYTDGLLHEVKPLGWLDSKSLVFNDIFGSEDGCSLENLKHVSEILKRCEGIPLFISGMSDYLREEVQQNSPSDGMRIIPKVPRQIEQSLATIYDDLSYKSKASLMYMSIFAEGHIFYRDSLCWKWIVEGLIDDTYRDTFEAEAEADTYFSELVDRNVISRVVVDKEHTSQEENCQWRVSYFMQQFLASKSAKDLFFSSDTLTSLATRGGKNLERWLSLPQVDPELPMLPEEMDFSHTRSLSISGEVGLPLDKFTHLLVLDLEGCQLLQDEDISRICKMFLLRYLSLRNTSGVSKLPPEIKELRLLEMLDISHTRIYELPSQVCELEFLRRLDLRSTPIRKLPEKFWELHMLRALLVGGDGVKHYETATEMPERINRIPKIHTLATVDLSGIFTSSLEALSGMRQLRVLAITLSFHQCSDKIFQESLRSALDKFRGLRSLTIHCGLGCCMDFLDSQSRQLDYLKKFKVANGRFSRLPQWVAGLSYLTSIEITVCSLEPADAIILKSFPELECLVLALHFIPEAAIVIDAVGFNKLKRLSVCCRIPWLTFNEGAMKKLAFLELQIAASPASEESVPSGISNLLSLTEVSIQYNEWYINSLSVMRTVVAMRQGVAQHRMPVNLFINGIEDEEEDVEAFEVARASTNQNEIEVEEWQWQEHCFRHIPSSTATSGADGERQIPNVCCAGTSLNQFIY